MLIMNGVQTKSDIAEPQELEGMESINLDVIWETAQRRGHMTVLE
jgi:hypothetical protein